MVHFEALMVVVFRKPAGCNVNEGFFEACAVSGHRWLRPFFGLNRIGIFAALTASQPASSSTRRQSAEET
jgi:hypothetical protein